MAVLIDAERKVVESLYHQEISNIREGITINRADLRAAINAIDSWVDTNSTSFNNAIPQPARANLTAKQKARLLAYVVKRRFEIS